MTQVNYNQDEDRYYIIRQEKIIGYAVLRNGVFDCALSKNVMKSDGHRYFKTYGEVHKWAQKAK